MTEPVRIESRLISRIGVREWGLPSLCMPGKIWRSEHNNTITCMTHKNEKEVHIETCELQVISVGEMSWMPDNWRAALWEYCQAYPSSGCEYGPFLAISESERFEFLKRLGQQLAESNIICCRHVADCMGRFAAWEYELPSCEIVETENITTKLRQ